MKRFLTLLLVLCLCVPTFALAEGGGAELPRVGDVVHGFEVVEMRDFPLIDAVVVRFEHQKTGAPLFYIANDDTNRAFNLGFFTEAIDNTGLPHVFEHATIQGSEKFPGEQMFFGLTYQTYNTYLNAQTSQRYTAYPIASLSEAQLLKLAEFYTDACFYPVIMENEHIFRTEAWRYRLERPEDPLTLEGTVYSEMLGAINLSRAAFRNSLQATYPGSTVGNVSGGDPEYIPDMTWQMLKDYHERYYHPSNSAAYLYGAFEDYGAFLELLDGYYSRFERREFLHEDAGYAPITESVTESVPFPTEQGSDTLHASDTYYTFLCPGLKADARQALILNTMTDLLTNSGSILHQRLQDALPYGTFTAYLNDIGPEYAIVFSAFNIDPGDAETFRGIVDDTIADVARDGFPQELVDSVAASLEISARLTRENSEPVNSIILPMLSYFASTGDPWNFMDYQEALFSINDWNAQGLYARATSDWLSGQRITTLVTTWPEPGAKEANAAATAEKLAAIKAGMSDEEIAAIVEATNAEAPEDRSAEYVAQLKAVTVDSLPEEIRHYDVSDVTDDQGIRHIDAIAPVDGISEANILLDAAGFAQEDIHWIQLYTDMLGNLDTARHTRAELANLMNRYLYMGSIFLSIPRDGWDGYHPYLRMRWIALDDDLATGYDLVRELVFDTRVDDPAKLLEQVQAVRTRVQEDITDSPSTVLLRRALGRTMPIFAYTAYAKGTDYYQFLEDVARQLRETPEAVTAKLAQVKDAFNNRANAVTMCAGNETSIALNRELSDAFLAALDEREIVPAEYDFTLPAGREAMIIESGVQYNLVAGNLDTVGLDASDGGLGAIGNVINDGFLMPLLRDQYGVYSPATVANDDYIYIYTYRDPNIAETFETLEQLPRFLSELELDQETLDGYIMNAYSSYAMPEGALSGPERAALDTLQRLDPDRKLEYMRQLKALTPEAVRESAKIYEKLLENGVRMTAGAASAIRQNAGLFDAILDPFGTGD